MDAQQQQPVQEGISIQFAQAPSQTQARFHTLNQGDEIQRENITNDTTSGLLIQADLEKVIRGKESPTGDAATLIVVSFRFQGLNQRRRFREVQITIHFEDKTEPLLHDPVIVGLWPDLEYTLSEQTPVTVEETRSIEGGGSAGATGGGANVTAKWEVKTTTERTDRAILTGSRVRIGRNYGSKNAVSLSLYENKSQKSGVVRDFRTAILLRLHDETERFRAYFSIDALVDLKYVAAKGLHQILGDRKNDPVNFKRGVQFFGPSGQQSSAQEIIPANLGLVNLRQLGDAVSMTKLNTLRDDAPDPTADDSEKAKKKSE
jgi:hypothetical protein